MRATWSLRGRLVALFVAFGIAALLIVGLGLLAGAARPTGGFVLAGVIAGFGLLGCVAALWLWIDTRLARPVDALAGMLRVLARGDGPAVDVPHLGDLGPAAQAMAGVLAQTRGALTEAGRRETARLRSENARLEALLADVPVGVLLCSDAHLLAFYNGPAVDLIGAGAGDPGLDRPLFDFLREGPILHAHTRLKATGDPDAASDLLATTRDGARVLAARMRLRPDAGGYVLTLRDVTTDLDAHARREALLTEVFDQMRRPAAALVSLVAALPTGADPLEAALRDEVARLAQSVTALSQRHETGRAEAVPMPATRASDLLDGARARIEADGLTVTTQAADLLLTCNGFEMIALIAGLADDIGRAGIARDLSLRITEDGSGALLRLAWTGAPVGMALLERWLDAALEPGLAGVSRRTVLATHATDIWPETAPDGAQSLCLPIPHARRAVTRPAPLLRPVVYDFDLLSRTRSAGVHDSPLSALTYVVFDTETTGLLPDQGDEIVQIAAVRIVNGRRLEGEVFDTLVNPGRPIPGVATRVHGITDAMVTDAPGMDAVAVRFHAFAQGAVLIAHNAPFDMAFLRRTSARTGLIFDHPVLDTVLLSAVIFGQQEVHTLDALIHRLGLTIPEEARHTAIGDSIVTADAFLKLLAMLQDRGLDSFGTVLTEVRRHGRLLKDLN